MHMRDALTHLYDPAYEPPAALWEVLGGDPQQGMQGIQAAIVRAIEGLRPAPDTPPTARSIRLYELLSCRYVQDLTQEEAARRLNITARHLRREQREAVHVLARRLWEQGQARTSLPSPPLFPPPAWRSQVRQELAALQKSAPGTVADVAEAVQGVVELESALGTRHKRCATTSRQGVRLQAEPVPPDLYAAIHPSALRQILIAAIEELAQHAAGQIVLRAGRTEERVTLSIAGHLAAAEGPLQDELIHEIVAAQGGSARIDMAEERIVFYVELPRVDKATVLVIDDNMDLVHFYRRYTAGTRYHIVHAAQGRRVLETIAATAPDLIVLDVMLPDVDGWELLVHLHEHPASRDIPIIVCSVVREQDLALALGATLYLAKPVHRQEFIQALDQALGQTVTRTTTARASSVATG